MNHDIVHCKGGIIEIKDNRVSGVLKECPMKETCYRYIAYLDIKNKPINIDMLVPSKVPCDLYIKEKSLNK